MGKARKDRTVRVEVHVNDYIGVDVPLSDVETADLVAELKSRNVIAPQAPPDVLEMVRAAIVRGDIPEALWFVDRELNPKWPKVGGDAADYLHAMGR